MKPVEPTLPGKTSEYQVNLSAPGCQPLPVIKYGAFIMSRWRMTWWERIWVAITGDVYLCVIGGQPPCWIDVSGEEWEEQPRGLRLLKHVARVNKPVPPAKQPVTDAEREFKQALSATSQKSDKVQ